MISKENIFIWAIGGALALFVASYLSSLLFFLLSGYNVSTAAPWSIWQFTGMLLDETVKNRFMLSLAIPHAVLIAGIIKLFAQQDHEFGDARWANAIDIKKSGLFKKNGLILGKYNGQYLISDTPTHALVSAPTRSGKGVGIVIPNLLNWSDSVICLDVKKENYRKTAGFRQSHGHDVFMWSPLDENGRSHRYNPLDAVSKNPHRRISDIQIIANILITNPPKSDPVWASEARALFIGLALYVIGNDDMPSTIGAINRLLGTEADLGDICKHIVKTHPELSTTLKKSLMNFANKAAKERSGVKSSINQAINLWDNPVIDAATSGSDFALADLRKKRIAIYVGVAPGEIDTLSPLLRIFFEQVITALSMKEPDESEPYHVLMLLDEFHMLGEMRSMTSAFTLLGGFNCRVLAIVQSLDWLDDTYGRDKRNGILSCCAHQIFFASNNLENAKYVSDSCGDKTIKTRSKTHSGGNLFGSPSTNTSSRSRPLISKDQAKQLPPDEQVILVENSRPVKAKKIQYFKDNNLKNRELPPPKLPILDIVDGVIPVFDIPSPDQQKQHYVDPKQSNLFTGGKANLTSALPETKS